MSSALRNIPGYPGLRASYCGRIFKGDREVKQSDHFAERARKSGYKTIWARGRHVKVHRLVGYAFIPNPHGKPYINHIDGNPSNNVASNLEWVTARENNRHARATGLARMHAPPRLYRDSSWSRSKRGHGNPRHRIPSSEIIEILRKHKEGVMTNREIGSMFRISMSYLGQLVRGDRRQDVERSNVV